jgi:hypothetical protein
MQNRVSLLFALGTCWGSAALAASPTTADLVEVLLAGLAVGDPVRAGSLSLFPLAARDPLREPATRIVTLGEAMERAWLTFRVVRDDESTCVLLQSWADAAILITAGEELPGCGGLAAVRDVLAPPGARGLAVPAKPVPGASGIVDDRSWQRRVRALEAIAAGFPAGCEGVLVAVGDRAARLELFPSAWLLSRARAGVLRAAAFEALADPGGPPLSCEEAERFLRELADLPWTRREPVGLGLEAGGSAPGFAGAALFLGGALVHLSADVHGTRLLLAAPEPTAP